MTRRIVALLWISIAWVGWAPVGCDPEIDRIPGAKSQIDLRMFTPPLQDAFAGVASLRVELRYPDGQSVVALLDQSTSDQVLAGPPGEDVVLRVEGLDIDGQLISSGQSEAFELIADEVVEVDLLFARVGEFARLLGRLNYARFGHTTSLTGDGLVLVFGGAAEGDLDSPGSLAPPELYDPRTQVACGLGAFDCPALTGADRRLGHTATPTAAGDVFIFGGRDETGQLAPAVLVYDHQGHDFRQLTGYDPARVQPRTQHTAVAFQIENSGDDPFREAILIAGGQADEGGQVVTLDTGLLFDTRLETFFRTDLPMGDARHSHTATVFGADRRLVLLAGGSDGFGLVAPVELFNGQAFQAVSPAGGGASGSLATPRVNHIAIETPDGVLIAAGDDGLSSLDAPEWFAFNSSLGTGVFGLALDALPPGHTPRTGSLAALLSSGGLLVAGGQYRDGFSRRLLDSAEVLQPDPATGQAAFSTAAPPGFGLAFASVTRLRGGGVLFVGGLKNGPDGLVPSDEVWYFNPG